MYVCIYCFVKTITCSTVDKHMLHKLDYLSITHLNRSSMRRCSAYTAV